jgi:hypothetical protein
MSWVGNREPEAAVEDEDFAQAVERVYEEDLMRSAEIVLNPLTLRPATLCKAQPYARFTQARIWLCRSL